MGAVGQVAHNFKDLTGQRFGDRVVTGRAGSYIWAGKSAAAKWSYKCDCGREGTATTVALKHSQSCGCNLSYIAKSMSTRKAKRGQCRMDSPTYKREGHLLRMFNMTLAQWELKAASQDNKCALCKRDFVYTPHVDHAHSCCPGQKSCGKCIRDLLCHNCNTAIGNLLESPELLRAAADYIERWRALHGAESVIP